ncbi:MAG: hypothetical protein ACYC8T_23820 [Myxococcaceae bacterium]
MGGWRASSPPGRARRAWLAALAEKGVSDARGVFLEVDGKAFITLRPFHAFAELDGRGEARARALAAIDPAQRKRYDDETDALLVFPHRNEIWSAEEALGYQAPEGTKSECAAGAARPEIEALKPAPPFEAQYEAAWSEARAALATVKYPLTRPPELQSSRLDGGLARDLTVLH